MQFAFQEPKRVWIFFKVIESTLFYLAIWLKQGVWKCDMKRRNIK